MAKKKSATSIEAEPKTATKAVKPATAKKSTAKSTTKAATDGDASTAAALGNHQIGETAGAVWNYLTGKEKVSLATIKKDLRVSSELLLAAVGWLAREDKLEFAGSGSSIKISLRS